MQSENDKSVKCDCIICREHHAFDMPPDLLNDFLTGKIALFAGSGISTENRKVLKFTFYEDIACEIGKLDSSLSFPDLMEEYCRLPNGRYKLLEKIRGRFQHIKSFPELERVATRFHKELATFFPQKTIVTTNWDTYFEEYCDATPFVTDEDLTFWNSSERKVLKVHGSITNYGSIVATSTDYKNCSKALEKGIVGSILKTILATQTIVFIGYSLSDNDFINIYNFVLKQMKGLHKQAYIITPFGNEREKFEKMGIIPIITDGTYFINQIKQHAINEGTLLSDNIYPDASFILEKVYYEHHKIHKNLSCFDHPQIIYASFYQDGMIHALERAIQLRSSGEYSNWCNIRNVIGSYLRSQKEKLKDKIYEDVAYIKGYINSLMFLLLDDEERQSEHPPMYFAFGINYDLMTFEDFQKVLHTLPEKHKTSYKQAFKRVKSLETKDNIEFHHPPWL